ncbi:MAG: serine/threonine protein kinase, partial [Chloroflexi bacterium]|nr:serine/threonine protein kinase [Chloroflexota bacterium]
MSESSLSLQHRATVPDFEPGARFGRFVIHGLIGRSALGSVFLAEEPGESRQVALKILGREFSEVPGFSGYLKTLAERITQLGHPNLVSLYRVGKAGGHIFIASAYVAPAAPRTRKAKPGLATLETLLASGPLSPQRALQILTEIVPALSYLHAEGLVHQNLKPSNVLFDSAGQAHLSDIGMAPLLEAALQTFSAGGRAGVIAYMSPEELNGKKVDALSDQYSLAGLFFHMLAGRAPFTAVTPRELFMEQFSQPVPSAHTLVPALPVSLDAVLARGMSFSPATRFSDLAEFLSALQIAYRTGAIPAEGVPGVAAAPPDVREGEMAPGERYYNYVIGPIANRGPLGVLYRAQEPAQDREVALRILRPEFNEVPQFVSYLRQVAGRFSELSHPRLIPVHRAGQAAGQTYVATGYAPFGSLANRLTDRPMSEAEALRIMQELAPALDYLHGRDIVHLDIKPSSILFDQSGALLGPVGLAPTLEAAARTFLPPEQAADPRYKSPEELAGRRTDVRSDQYSLAVILFQLATGRRPYVEETTQALFMAQYSQPVPSARALNPSLSLALDAALSRALSYSRAQRFDSVGQMLEGLTGRMAVAPPVVELPPAPEAVRRPPPPPVAPVVEAAAAAAPAVAFPAIPIPARPPRVAAPPQVAVPAIPLPGRLLGLPLPLAVALAAVVVIPAILAVGVLLGSRTATRTASSASGTQIAVAQVEATATALSGLIAPTQTALAAAATGLQLTASPVPGPTDPPQPTPTATATPLPAPTSSPTVSPVSAGSPIPEATLSPAPAPPPRPPPRPPPPLPPPPPPP